MNKLAIFVANGTITLQELASANDLIERAQFVKNGIDACKKTLQFPLGTSCINCYSYMDSVGEYEAWGTCTIDGTFTCYTNWGGNHIVGRCNLNSFEDVFMAFEDKEFKRNLQMFLIQQMSKTG